MSLNKGIEQLRAGTSQVSNVGGTSGDKRSAPLSWLDWWSQETANNVSCLGVCPLYHPVGTINVSCAVGGHMYLKGDTSHRYIVPICSLHNAQGAGTYYDLSQNIQAVKISKASSLSEKDVRIPVPAGTEHDPSFSTTYVGVDDEGQPLYSTEYLGSPERQASKIISAGPDLEHVEGGDAN